MKLFQDEETGMYYVEVPERIVDLLDWQVGDEIDYDDYGDHLNLYKI